MVWEPFALAVVMGLLVSAAIYFIVMWPQVEPPDGDDLVGDGRPDAVVAGDATDATDAAADAPAPPAA